MCKQRKKRVYENERKYADGESQIAKWING
jgi:hypothetical protein